MTPLLEVRKASKIYGGGLFKRHDKTIAIDNLSYSIPDENPSITAIAGESGSGKTTLGTAIVRLLRPPARITSGRIVLDGHEFLQAGERELRQLRMREVALIPQAAMNSLNPVMRIGDQIADGIIAHAQSAKIPRRDVAERVARALWQVGLQSYLASRYPHQLSGGQRQRVAVARAMILEPEFIVADEPVSMLDASVRISILRLLGQLQEKFGITFLYITHDLATARHFSQRVGIMYAGKIAEMGPVSEVLGEPLHPYTQALIEAIPDPDPENRHRDRPALQGEPPLLTVPPPGCRFHPRCPIAKAGLCDVEEPPLRELRPNHLVACHLAS